MFADGSWDIAGYEGNKVRNYFIESRTQTDKLAVFLPGYAYPIDAPLFHYSTGLLLKQGFDLLCLDYRYNENTTFRAAPEKVKANWIESDVRGLHQALVHHSRYRRLAIVGKSLGTTAMPHLCNDLTAWQDTAWIWLTPAYAREGMVRTLQSKRLRSLVIAGDRDEFYSKDDFSELEKLDHVEVHLVEGADHGLELEDNVIESTKLLPTILQWIDEFAARL